MNNLGKGLWSLNKLELIFRIKPGFPVGITKVADAPFCLNLSKQKPHVATLPAPCALCFTLTKDLIEGSSAENIN